MRGFRISHSYPHEDGREPIMQCLEVWLSRLPLRRGWISKGDVTPPKTARLSASPRFVLCLSGVYRMEIVVENKAQVIDLHPMEAIYIHRHAWNRSLHDRAFEFFVIDCQPTYIRYYYRCLKGPGTLPDLSAVHLLPGTINPTGMHLIRALESLPPGEPQGAAPLIEAFLWQAVSTFQTPASSPPLQKLSRWQIVCDIVKEHLQEHLTRTELARKTRMHPNHLSRLFRQCGDETFSQYLTRMRLERAVELLQRHDLSIKETAIRCGFRDATYFSHVFQRHYRCSPGHYRLRTGRVRRV